MMSYCKAYDAHPSAAQGAASPRASARIAPPCQKTFCQLLFVLKPRERFRSLMLRQEFKCWRSWTGPVQRGAGGVIFSHHLRRLGACMIRVHDMTKPVAYYALPSK